jgi:hypothetical protein
MKIQTSGYYRSQALPWEERHGGAHLYGATTQFWRFLSNGLWIGCNREDRQFLFWEFSKALDQDRIRDARTRSTGLTAGGEELFRVGVYRIEGEVLTAEHEWHLPLYPSGEQVHLSQWGWTIAGDRLIPLASSSTLAIQSYELEFLPC